MQSLLEEKRAKQRVPLRIVAAATAINIKVRAENLFLREEALVLGGGIQCGPFTLNNHDFFFLFYLRFTTINDLHFSSLIF